MALLSTGKIIASIATIGVGGSAGAGTYFFLTSGTTIEELIKTDTKQRIILDNSNKKAKGATAWKNYKTQNDKKKPNEDTWKLADWKESGTEMGETMPDSLISECAKRKEQKLQGRDNEDYKNFVAWCTEQGA